ncbi:MAG: GspE/PulE family protein [Lachnospiraceae bacterium]|nr:GspE/PulE family protein [Lachnospiraceae bacterium]
MAYYGQKKIRLGELLVDGGAITKEQLDKALAQQKVSRRKLGEILVDSNMVTEENIAETLAGQLHYALTDLSNATVASEILALVPAQVLRKNKALPIEYAPDNVNILRVAMADPLDLDAIDDISIITGCQVEPVVTTPRAVVLALDRLYGSEDMDTALEEYTKEKLARITEVDNEQSDDVSNSPIVMLVKDLIDKAALKRASDIHIEALESGVRVRFRIDGALYEYRRYPKELLPAIVARVKIIGGMDISEKRKPQDGRITQTVERTEYDIRVSVLPTVFGEKIVMRLQVKKSLTRNKAELGLRDWEMKRFDHIISNPHGILLVTGPTGSGKSTTLYTALSELNREDVNIITVEDPVEANIDGINQVQVNNKAELTFASSLRSILRQDPDIIMIGEIRDRETAEIAVQASITGHLVVSTLHTNSAASTITRLEDMGVEGYLIADSVVGVIAQRLVRRLCPECKQAHDATPDEREILGITDKEPHIIYSPKGCPKCDNMGYKGRIGVYEIMEMTPELRLIVSKGGTANDIKEQALKEGMHTLRMSASEYVLDGITSLSEMIKVSFDA